MFCGVVLIMIGAAGYIYGRSIGAASPTALIPAALGILLLLLGIIAAMRESLRKHLMHAAAALALIGFLVCVYRLVSNMSAISLSAATISLISMAVVCLIFVLAAVNSFAAVRRSRSDS